MCEYLSCVNQPPGVQKTESILVAMVILGSICIIITVVHIVLNT